MITVLATELADALRADNEQAQNISDRIAELGQSYHHGPAMQDWIRKMADDYMRACNLAPDPKNFQSRVHAWMLECFSLDITFDGTERNHRFLEESLELVQSLGCTKSEALQLVDYVYGRPKGAPVQEIGGVMVTLAALCSAHHADMNSCADAEIARCNNSIERIRAKQAAKPKHSPLPSRPEDLPESQANRVTQSCASEPTSASNHKVKIEP
jgi:hypothetical protein